MTIRMKVGALAQAKTSLTNLADDIESARTRALAATPSNLSLSSLSISGVCGSLPTWLRDQAADPIGVVLDLARLLDENGNGQATYTSAGGESLGDLRTELGRLIADGLSKVDENDRRGMQSYSDLMARYGDDAAVMGSVLSTLGRDGTQDVLNRADDLEVDIAPSFGDEGQKIIAGWVAEDVRDPDEIDSQTNVFLESFRDQAAFATALYSDVTPDEMGDAIKHLSNRSFPADGMTPTDVELAKVYDQFLNYAGHTLATYSQDVSDPAGLADDWYDAITGDGTDDVFGHENPENAAALTLLIKRGGQQAEFDDVFLGDLTNSVYDWERSFGGDAIWGPLGEQLGDGYGIKDPDMDYGDTSTAEDNQAFGVGAFDGLANLMSGMEKSPEAAERFFTYESDGTYVDQVGYEGQNVNEKLLYLMRDRTWPTDDGDGFGIALQHAATHSRGEDEPGVLSESDRAARLASQTIFIVANERGEGDGWGEGQLFPDDGWQIPEGMRDNMGYMLAAYAPDINRISQADGDVTSGNNWIYGDEAGESAYHGIMGLSASNEDLAAMLQGIGAGDDKEGITAVLTSQVAHHENLMNDAVSTYNEEHPNAPKTIEQLKRDDTFMENLSRTGASNGQALEYVLSNGVAGGTDNENSRKERAEMMAKAFSIGTSFLPGAGEVLGETASELAKNTYGAVSSEALGRMESRIGAAPEGLTEQWGGDSDRMVREGLSYGTYNALLNAGYLDPSVDPEYGIPPGAVTAPNESGRVFVDPALYDGKSDEDDDPETVGEFNNWLQTSAPRSMVETMLNGYSNKVSPWIS